MIFEQKEIQLQPYSRGFHLITEIIKNEFPAYKKIQKGFLKVFIKHTSASLTINENADPTVRQDFESHFNKMIAENAPYFIHTYEGSDDMPAHLKASLLGNAVEVPITNGQLNLGIWQGIYLGEHRNFGGARKLVVTAFGV
ncbi:secondary thiamine-phosphate synthase enzyme YjbQ [Polaribacter sp.]|uniref:secondary thiamine-phosphate synthase enzyme YjbQ n=1 Tax=Polaribacter sp. TaxID=1920175 RepID=UPI003F6C92C7